MTRAKKHYPVTEGENLATCFKFATHMFGNGVGSLRVWFRPVEASEENPSRILWEMSGDSGNNWYMAQLPIASAVPFQIAFEGVVGSNYLGNIAIDSISLESGSCPSKFATLVPLFAFRGRQSSGTKETRGAD